MTLESKIKKCYLLQQAALPLFITACGGGGSSPTAPSPNPNPNPTPTNITLRVNARDTFTGAPLSVDYVAEGCGQKVSGKTDGSPTQAQSCSSFTVRVGMDQNNNQSNQQYVPTIFENQTILSDTVIDTDLPKYSTLFTSIEPKWVIEVYRGRENGGKNQVWRSQPTEWIVSDPGNELGKYPDPKNNIEFNNIMKGYAAVEDYTRGYIKAPSREAVKITNTDLDARTQLSPGQFVFKIIGAANEWEYIRNDVILASYANSPTRNSALNTLTSEMVSCVQGGDSESDGYYLNGMRNRPLNDLDRVWGDFNYHKRNPGDVILPSGDTKPSPYGFPVEIRTR